MDRDKEMELQRDEASELLELAKKVSLSTERQLARSKWCLRQSEQNLAESRSLFLVTVVTVFFIVCFFCYLRFV